ncbi:hypothetical protein ABZP36_006174 [Zizania latifolia]
MVMGVTCLVCHLLRRRSASIRTQRSTLRLLSEASCTVPLYTYREIERATNDFAEDQQLGTGAYGTVYAGRLSNNRLVAVKRIKQRDNAGLDRVMNEVKLVSSAVDFSRVGNEVNLAQLAVDRIGRGCVDDIVDPYLDPHRDAWTLTSIHKVAELAFRCLAFHSEMRPSMAEVADELEQIQVSGWAPSTDDAAFMSTTSSLCSSAPSRCTDKSWGTGKSRKLAAAKQETPKGAAADSPVSVQERWFRERSSPSSNSLLGNGSLN